MAGEAGRRAVSNRSTPGRTAHLACALAVAAQLLQVVLFIGYILIKTFEDTAADDPQLAIRVLGFSSTSEIVTMLLVFMFLMLVVLLSSALYAMRRDAVVPTFRLQGTGLPPELTLKAGQRYHGFVSHAWSTAQAPCPMSRTTGPLCAPCRLTHTSEPQPRRRMPQPPSSGSFSECCPPSASFWVSHSTSPVARHPMLVCSAAA